MKENCKRFIVLEETSYGAMFCLGVFDDARTAIGEAYINIWEFAENYSAEGDVFEVGLPVNLEGDFGYFIPVVHKNAAWKEACTDRYHILFDLSSYE